MSTLRVVSKEVEVIKLGKKAEDHDCKFHWVTEFNEISSDGIRESLQICEICGRAEKVTEKLETEETFEEVYKKFHGEDFRKE